MLAFSLSTFSQDKELKKGNSSYETFSFTKAIDIYERVAEKGHVSTELYQKLGNSYYFNANLEGAKKWYKKLFDLNEKIDPEYYFRYSHVLKSAGEYEEADKMMKEFNKITNSSDLRGKLFANNPAYLQSIKAQSGRYKIENLDINSEYSDFAPSFYENQLIFSSARDTGSISKYKHKWTDKFFLDLYKADIQENGSVNNVSKFSKKINTKFHESTSVFTEDGNTVYFTRNNYANGKTGKNSQGVVNLKIYRATKNENNVWGNIQELPFNSNEYSVAHPTLSPDETKLYFSSDMPGGYGLSDIYEVEININGTFEQPKNLGKKINTEARETFPFVNNNNDLYFTSDGQPGLGGLDIFVTNLKTHDSISTIRNLGEPINSTDDDFSFIINDYNQGYFASNRKGGKGNDDIYSLIKKAECNYITGFISDQNTNEILANSKVVLINDKNEVIDSTKTDVKGAYLFHEFDCKKKYFVRVSKEDYFTKGVIVKTNEELTNIELEKNLVKVKTGDDLGKILVLKPIYFDLGKSYIRKDAMIELEKIVAAMKKYSRIKIDVRSHTDSRAGDKFNLLLSDRRAKSTVKYIIDQGIDKSRISEKGYGETQLINNCSNGVECSEEEHQLNRRSEFIIMKN